MKSLRASAWAATVVLIALAAISGCYSTTHEAGRTPRPPDDRANEDASSSVPPLADDARDPAPAADAPSDPADAEPGDREPMKPGSPEPEDADLGVPILAEPGFVFMQNGRIVGDLDGDGFDDLVLFAVAQEQLEAGASGSAVYVFHGGEELPESLVAASADAVFQLPVLGLPAPELGSDGAAGDLNGDGLADVVIGGGNQVFFLFGSEQRMSGRHQLADVAPGWTFPDEVSSAGWTSMVRVRGAGDVQGDGLADFTITVITDELIAGFPGGFGASPVDSTFLVAGREGPWPSGAFSADWAETAFVVDDAQFGGCTAYGAGDFDGDGLTDLVLKAENRQRLVRGGDGAPAGTIQATQAGDAFDFPGDWLRALPDLDGDGSEELVWTASLGSEELFVTYGGADLDPARLVEPDTRLVAQGTRLPAVAVTDFDGDGTQELLVVAGASAATPFGLYAIAIDGLRDARQVSLDDARDLLHLGGREASSDAPALSLGLDAGGDVNGDGVDDLLITTMTDDEASAGKATVRLLLGGMR